MALGSAVVVLQRGFSGEGLGRIARTSRHFDVGVKSIFGISCSTLPCCGVLRIRAFCSDVRRDQPFAIRVHDLGSDLTGALVIDMTGVRKGEISAWSAAFGGAQVDV